MASRMTMGRLFTFAKLAGTTFTTGVERELKHLDFPYLALVSANLRASKLFVVGIRS